MDTLETKEASKKAVEKAVAICGSQSALARKVGITQGAVSKYMRGECIPTGQTAKRLSAAVNGEIKPVEFAPHIFG